MFPLRAASRNISRLAAQSQRRYASYRYASMPENGSTDAIMYSIQQPMKWVILFGGAAVFSTCYYYLPYLGGKHGLAVGQSWRDELRRHEEMEQGFRVRRQTPEERAAELEWARTHPYTPGMLRSI